MIVKLSLSQKSSYSRLNSEKVKKSFELLGETRLYTVVLQNCAIITIDRLEGGVLTHNFVSSRISDQNS